MKRLSPKQDAFCVAYVACGNATEAYRQAGYKTQSDRAACSAGNRLLTNVEIIRQIEKIKQEANTPKIMTAQQRREVLSEIAWDKNATKSDRINAMNVLNKMDALYLQRQEITGAVPVVMVDDVCR